MLTLRTSKLVRGEDRLTEADKTFLMILGLSDLDLEKLVRLCWEEDNQEKFRELQQDFEEWCRYFNKENLECIYATQI